MNRLSGLPLHRVQTVVKYNFFRLTELLQRVSSPVIKKCEGTVFEKAGVFLKNVAVDYKEVFVETYDSTITNPVKMSMYVGVLGFGALCAALNPDETSFRDALLSNEKKIMLLSEPIRNPLPVQKMKEMEEYYNQGRMQIFSLGVVSFMWITDYDDRTAMYEAKCNYLGPSYLSYFSRVVDIGFFGKWWFLSRCMVDYDVNPEEFNDVED